MVASIAVSVINQLPQIYMPNLMAVDGIVASLLAYCL
ncbi:MAG: hypothetical protein GPOALKHO_000643 [Sodalis sp.]|nr:MAG: hypothetical protein GPOALKHO_000643 [Sodalis sp.]